MPPVRCYTNWNMRSVDSVSQIEPYKKFFFICEGEKTETWYFTELINQKKNLGIKSIIDIRLLEKTEGDKDISFPINLIKFAETQKDNPDISFDRDHDTMIVVFDADIFESRSDRFEETIKLGEELKDVLAISNPAFELFLLLHYCNSYNEIILPNAKEILSNEKVGNQTYIAHLFSEKSGMNSKRNPKIGQLAANVLTAISQEKFLNQDIKQCRHTLSCNVGKTIEEIINA